MIANILKNWKTTSVGGVAFFYAVGDVIAQASSKNWDLARLHTDLVSIMAGVGFIFSKDHNA